MVLEAVSSYLLFFCESCPPGKSPFNFTQRWKATAQELTADSDAFCTGASGDASWEWRG